MPRYPSGGLPPLNSGQLWIGNSSNVATSVTASGDATISNTGVISLVTQPFKCKAATIEHQETHGVTGGTAAGGAWTDLVLNTTVQDNIGITLSSNQVTLPAGTYIFRWHQPFYGTNESTTRLYNVTSGAYIALGTGWLCSVYGMSHGGAGPIVFASSTTVKLQYLCKTASANTYALGNTIVGQVAGETENEVYTHLEILQIA